MAEVISLDKIADSIEALKDADEQRRELNWKIWRQVQRRRVSEMLRDEMAHEVWPDTSYFNSRFGAIEMLYDARHGVSGAWSVEVK